jgi:hypothetical protein
MPLTVEFAVDVTEGSFAEYTKKQVGKLRSAILEEVDAINGSLADALREAYSGGIVQRRTGAAADSVKVIPAEEDGEYTVGAVEAGGDSAPEVEWLETGTAPHIIEAKEGGVLAFEMGGHTVFARVVHHPGTRAYGIFEQVEEEVPLWEQKLQELPEFVFG